MTVLQISCCCALGSVKGEGSASHDDDRHSEHRWKRSWTRDRLKKAASLRASTTAVSPKQDTHSQRGNKTVCQAHVKERT